MERDFEVGDRVEINPVGTGYGVAVGTIVSFNESGKIASVLRDDKVLGSGFRGGWLVRIMDLTLLEPATEWKYPVSQTPEKKGWQPDGFDADAHRDFMQNL
jgi:hypothetical protein